VQSRVENITYYSLSLSHPILSTITVSPCRFQRRSTSILRTGYRDGSEVSLINRAVVLEYCTRTRVQFFKYSFSKSKYSYLYSNAKVLGFEQKLAPEYMSTLHYETYRIVTNKKLLSHAF